MILLLEINEFLFIVKKLIHLKFKIYYHHHHHQFIIRKQSDFKMTGQLIKYCQNKPRLLFNI